MTGLLRSGRRIALAVVALAALSGCEPAVVGPPAVLEPADGADSLRPVQSEVSRALSRYYSRVQDGLLSQGLLRTDGGGPDVPFTARNLADNFVRIALYEEYTNIGGRIVPRETVSQLHRWEGPIRMTVEFGATVPADQRQIDRTRITAYTKRLSRITGLPIRQAGADANYHVFIVNEDERRQLGTRIREILPGIDNATIRAVEDMPRSTFCLVFAVDQKDDAAYTQAVAVIRAEHPDLMRLSCIHEELAQSLGLPNDSPSARPSVFNDDEEFGLLTTHDEMLLRILYDKRMRAGMGIEEARAMAEIIAAELLGGES